MPSSTQWDVVHARVSAVEPVYRELIRLAAQSSVVHNDDTYMRVLEFMGKRRANMSLIHTTELDGGNAFHYLTALMRHEKAVARHRRYK